MRAVILVVAWLFYGAGGSLTSPGMDQIAAQLKASGIVVKGPYDYMQASSVAAEIKATPGTKAVIGYSCGVGASAQAANESGVRIALVAGIQGSIFCPPPALLGNVASAIEVYNPNCGMTFGIGCATYKSAPPFPGHIRLIPNNDSHGYADINLKTQRIIVQAVRALK